MTTTISLDQDDAGVQWIPGFGFRPVDWADWFCGQVVEPAECVEDECSFGKGDDYDMVEQFFEPLYSEPVAIAAPPAQSMLHPTPVRAAPGVTAPPSFFGSSPPARDQHEPLPLTPFVKLHLSPPSFEHNYTHTTTHKKTVIIVHDDPAPHPPAVIALPDPLWLLVAALLCLMLVGRKITS